RVKFTPSATSNRRVASPPVMVMMPPPSIVVAAVMVCWLAIRMVHGPPQLKVTFPPPARASCNSASSHEPGVPSPTTSSASAAPAAASGAARTDQISPNAISRNIRRSIVILPDKDAARRPVNWLAHHQRQVQPRQQSVKFYRALVAGVGTGGAALVERGAGEGSRVDQWT